MNIAGLALALVAIGWNIVCLRGIVEGERGLRGADYLGVGLSMFTLAFIVGNMFLLLALVNIVWGA